jgi:hypothetical protein
MKSVTLLSALGLVALAAPTQAQLFNEIYGRHDGNDDQEYIEIRGLPGNSFDGFMVVIVEGEYPNAGYIDRAWDLTGEVVPASGFYTLGVNAMSPDYSIGNSNRIENGTQTIYLVQVADPSLVLGAVGTVDLDPDDDGNTTLAAFASIFDVVGLADRDYDPGGVPGSVDEIFDGATVIGPMPELGPDLNDFPTGVFREGDAPNPWCLDTFLDYYDEVNTDKPRTPGAANTATCDGNTGGGPEIGVAFCFGDGSAGACPCGNAGDGTSGCAHSGGVGMTMVASGGTSIGSDNLVLTIQNGPPGNVGIFYCGDLPLPTGNPLYDGLQCAGGNVRRFQPVNTGGTGTTSDTGFVAQEPTGTYFVAGNNYAFQGWFRDAAAGPSPCGNGAQFSNALWILLGP